MRQSFTEYFVQTNRFDERSFHSWAIRPGMEYGAATTWWKIDAARPQPHEGIDFYSYVDADGKLGHIEPGTLIPCPTHGTLADIFPDFLGQSLLFAEDLCQGGWRSYFIVAHVEAEMGVVLGRRYRAGDIIARLPKSPSSTVPAHLHVSTVTILGAPPRPLTWPVITDSNAIRVVDPGLHLGCFAPNSWTIPA